MGEKVSYFGSEDEAVDDARSYLLSALENWEDLDRAKGESSNQHELEKLIKLFPNNPEMLEVSRDYESVKSLIDKYREYHKKFEDKLKNL
ncbi:MAG: hypothetical protein ABIH72_03030 [archaeon]